MIYGDLFFIRYDPEENAFYDDCSFRILNIFEAITPNDLFLFRQDKTYNTFVHRNDPNILCEIFIGEGSPEYD